MVGAWYAIQMPKVTIALFGDSHATSWFPAVARLAEDRGWRFLNVTEGGCPSLALDFWNPNTEHKCSLWLGQAVARLVAERPNVVVINN